LGLYRVALRGFVDRPLLGWGPGNFQLAWQKHVDSPTLSAAPDSWGTDAHDLPLELLTVSGGLGLLALSAVGVLWVAALVRRRRQWTLQVGTAVAVAVAFGIPLGLNPQSIVLTPLFFLFAGMAAAIATSEPANAATAFAPADDFAADQAANNQFSEPELHAGAAPGRTRSTLLMALTVLASVALVASVYMGQLSLRSDRQMLTALITNDGERASAAARAWPVYPLTLFVAANTLVASPAQGLTLATPTTLYQQGLGLRPNDAYGLLALAGAQIETSQFQLGADTARRALLVFPLSVQARVLLGRAQQEMGLNADAIKTSHDAIAIATPSARTYYLAAQTIYHAGDNAGAKALLNEGLKRYPGDASLTSALSQVK
jgi:hypothetical protein